MAKIGIFNAATNENKVIEVDEEVLAEIRKPDLELQVKNEQIAVAKAAAEAKLAALGLTTEDLQALGLGGN